jgi:hypothetical protein
VNYRVMKRGSYEHLDAIELHLLARAYCAAWKRLHGSEPIHEHVLPSLDLVIYFVAAPTLAGTTAPSRP